MKIFAEITVRERYVSEIILASKLELPASEIFNESAKDYDDLIIEHLTTKHQEEDCYNYSFYIKRIARKTLTNTEENVIIDYSYNYDRMVMVNLSKINFREEDLPYQHIGRLNNYFEYNVPGIIYIKKVFDTNKNDISKNEDYIIRMIINTFRKDKILKITDKK